nr:hypothetical protein [Mesorhizobium mediterraneum]
MDAAFRSRADRAMARAGGKEKEVARMCVEDIAVNGELTHARYHDKDLLVVVPVRDRAIFMSDSQALK